MSSETFTYKGISAGKYIEGEIEAINQEEASFKLKEQKIIITNLTKLKKKKAEKEKGKKSGFSFAAFFFFTLIRFVIMIFCSLSL